MEIEIKEPITVVLAQTNEKVVFEESGILDVGELDLRMERIIAQSNGKIKLIKKGTKKWNSEEISKQN